MNTRNRVPSLDRLALGSNCPRCGAGTDQECRTPSGRPTLPHADRIDRAVAQYTPQDPGHREDRDLDWSDVEADASVAELEAQERDREVIELAEALAHSPVLVGEPDGGEEDHCAGCGVLLDHVLSDETAAHWDTRIGTKIVAWSCGPKCRAAVEARRNESGVLVPPASLPRLQQALEAQGFTPLVEALAQAGTPHMVEQTGGGVMAVVVHSDANDGDYAITPDMDEDDQPVWWICFYEGDSWHTGGEPTLEADHTLESLVAFLRPLSAR